MCGLMWGPVGKELVGLMFLIAQVLCVGGGVLGISIALNALSDHSRCTTIFSLVATILVTLFSCIRTLGRIGWLTWIGFFTLLVAVLIVVIGVTTRDRPCYLPVASEMRRPRDYHRAALITGVLVGAMYLSFGLVVYRWCGQWVANPSLGSAGPLLKKVAYGIALPGLIVGTGIYNHMPAKYLFVRILRGSRHLQENTATHWGVWLGSNVLLGAMAFVLAEAIPIFNYILALAGAVCFAPMTLMMPALLWMWDFKGHRKGSRGQRAFYALHVGIVLVGAFMLVGGT
jgi:hypothetical protein